jgi:hypothetical protein
LKALSGKRLAEHAGTDVTGYLESVGRRDGIKERQFLQIVEAVRTLLVTADAKVVGEVDWAYWRDSARTLAPGHPTIAREVPARAGASADQAPVSGARFKEKRNPPSALDEVRRSHPRLMERLAAEIRRRKYSIRTEQTDASWVCRFILFCGGRDPSEVGADRIVAFLEDLAVRGQVSASTQNQALNALVFLCKQVLGQALNALGDFTRAKRPRRLPVVLSRGEVARPLEQLDGMRRWPAQPNDPIRYRQELNGPLRLFGRINSPRHAGRSFPGNDLRR